jgi:hypothetical protein
MNSGQAEAMRKSSCVLSFCRVTASGGDYGCDSRYSARRLGAVQLDIRIDRYLIGRESLRQFGTTVKPGLLETVRAADG